MSIITALAAALIPVRPQDQGVPITIAIGYDTIIFLEVITCTVKTKVFIAHHFVPIHTLFTV